MSGIYKNNHSSLSQHALRLLLMALAVWGAAVVYAQKNVTGTVTDSNGEPLVGVSVSVKNAKIFATTDANGRFSITTAKDDDVLLFRYVGMDDRQVSVTGRQVINVKMTDTSQTLGEVTIVSTGYQKISRERSTAAFGFVDSTAINRQLHRNLESALEGQVAGLRMELNPYTGEMSPILRGIGTFSSDVGTQPLVVIDNMPTNMQLSQTNPYDVESVTVLKDAAAASIYGALAANGVIVVTTKQGKGSKVNVSVNADWYITTKPSFKGLDLASTSDIIDYQTDVYNAQVARAGSVGTLFQSFATNYYSPLFQLYRDRDEGRLTASDVEATLSKWRGNDYYDEFRDNAWRTAVTQRYNVSLSQRMGKSNHFASFNFESNKNRLIHDKGNTFGMYLKSKYDIARWINVTVGMNARLSHENQPNNYDYNLQERYADIIDADGNRVISPYVNVGGYTGSAINGSVVSRLATDNNYRSFGFNVLDALGEGISTDRNMLLRPFVNVEAQFLKHFQYNMMYQYEWSQLRSETYDDQNDYIMRMTYNAGLDDTGKAFIPSGGRYYQSTQSYSRYTLRNQLSYSQRFGRAHDVNAIVGLEFRENKKPRINEQLMYGYNPVSLTSERMDWNSLYTDGWTSGITGNRSSIGGLTTSQTLTRHRYASFYANAGYTYLYKYSLTGSIRWDEADLFGLETRQQRHPLWSIGGSWTLSEEQFMKPVKWVDFLKLRLTYGVNGNVDQSSTTFFTARYKTQSNPIRTTYLYYDDDDLPNPQLRWEKTATLNLGLDFRLLGNRINGSIEYYNRHANDLLVRHYMDPTIGAKSRVINNGEMRNRGVELNMTGRIYSNKDWDISASFTYAHNSNMMLKVDHSDSDYASLFIRSSSYYWEGTSFNTLWAYRYSRTVNGYPVIVDKDGKELATFDDQGNVLSVTSTSSLKGTESLVNMGSYTPTFNGSLNLHAAWRGLELNMFFVYSGGNKLRLPTASLSDWDIATNDILNRWSTTNNVPRLYVDMDNNIRNYASTFSEWWQYSDIQVRDADYIKMRSLSLACTLPRQWTKAVGVGTTKLSLQVNNLFTWCKAGHDIDPETYGLNSGSRSMTQPKTFAVGLSTSF